MPTIAADFGAAIKGKRTVESLRDAINTTLANAKIESNATADKIQINMGTLRDLAGAHTFLFPDTAQIVLKAGDDFTALVKLRIAEHDAKEAARLEAERTRIRAEEQTKAEAAARDKLAAEAEAARMAKEREDKISADAVAAAAKVIADAAAVTAFEAIPVVAVVEVEAPAVQAAPAARRFAGPPMVAKALAAPPSMKLGDINALIAPLSINVAGLVLLGFEPAAVDKSSRLYHHSDFPAIRAALISHLSAIEQPVTA